MIPHIFDPVGTSDPNAPMIMIEPGEQKVYHFAVPPNQPSGLYFYHPHNHGAVSVQLWGGMAGAIVVRGPIDEVPEIAAARDEFMVFQSIGINPDLTTPDLWTLEFQAYQPPTTPVTNAGGFQEFTRIELITVNGSAILEVDSTAFPTPGGAVFTQLDVPTYTMQPGEVIRLRMLNGTPDYLMPLYLPGFEVYLIGIDGINLLAPQLMNGDTSLTAMRMSPANRFELLIKAPMQPIASTMVSLAQDEFNSIGFTPNPQFNVANFVVRGTPKPMAIPASLPIPTREYPLIGDDEIVAQRTVSTNIVASSANLTGNAFQINGQSYAEDQIVAGPAINTAEEWTLVNPMTNSGHPFHLHTNSFQVMGLPFDPSYLQIQDTIWVPPASDANTPSTVTIRIRFKEYLGKDVFHCHISPHEDLGMMANILVSETEGPPTNAGTADQSKAKVNLAYCVSGRWSSDSAIVPALDSTRAAPRISR